MMGLLIPIIVALAAILALFISKPKRRILAWVTVSLILIPAIWQVFNEYSEQSAVRERKIHVIKKLSGSTDRFLDLISYMIFSASDGWLPQNEEEFFSQRTADLICRELNIDKSSRWYSESSWRQSMAVRAQKYEKSLREVLTESCGVLDADLVQKISSVAGSDGHSALLFSMMRAPSIKSFDIQYSVERAPLLCWGWESNILKSLADIRALFEEIREQERDLGIVTQRDWLVFPIKNYPNLLGEDRFGPEELEQWRASHPSEPGPGKSFLGDPNKR